MQPPNRNLTPDSQYWGRWMEKRVTELETATAAQGQSTTMALAGINSSIGKLSDQVAAINALQVQMAATISELDNTVDDLAAAQTQINTLLADQVVGAVAIPNSTNGWSITTSYSIKVSTSLTVPSGYTRALVWANASQSLVNNGTGDCFLDGYQTIGSSTGNVNRVYVAPQATNRPPAVLVTSHTASLTGLSGGGTINLNAYSLITSTTNVTTDIKYAQISGAALFLK